ncbi:hypothetical protein [Bacillus sp. 1P06AnD]|uniref:hypothetical protein n=1 Tax=Bacillus sp. 1P06AnD TaxID=3132208 RepID=UPI0039A1D013
MKKGIILRVAVFLINATLYLNALLKGVDSKKEAMVIEVTEYLKSNGYNSTDIESIKGIYSLKEEKAVSKYSALVTFKGDGQRKYIYVKRLDTNEINQERVI